MSSPLHFTSLLHRLGFSILLCLPYLCGLFLFHPLFSTIMADSHPSTTTTSATTTTFQPSSSSSSRDAATSSSSRNNAAASQRSHHHHGHHQRILDQQNLSILEWTHQNAASMARDDSWSCLVVLFTFWFFGMLRSISKLHSSSS